MASQQQTLQQKRAAAAWQQVDQEVPSEARDKYGTWARKLPTLIQTNGLGAAMAFLLSKAKGNDRTDGYGILYRHVSEWVTGQMRKPKKDLMDLIRESSSNEYRWVTAEAIEYAMWLRRYVEAKNWGSAEGDDQ